MMDSSVPAKIVIGTREFPLVKNGSSNSVNCEYYKLGSWGNRKEGVEGEGLVRVTCSVDADLYAEIAADMEE